MIPYKCVDPTCTNDTAWHLIHGDFECIGMNKEAVAEYVTRAEEAFAAEASADTVYVSIMLTSADYEDMRVAVEMVPKAHYEAEVPPAEPEPEMEM